MARRGGFCVQALPMIAVLAACSSDGTPGSGAPDFDTAAPAQTIVATAPPATSSEPTIPSSVPESSATATTGTAATSAPPTTTALTPATEPDRSIVSEFADEPWFVGTVPAIATSADDGLEPIRLGMINQEDTPVGSYPEIRVAVEAAVDWVNAELGGVDGRPIELHTCITTFDPGRSRACAFDLVDAGVIAFVGGVDVLSDASIPVIEQNGLFTFGGIPANLAEQRSRHAFFFSGGDVGALAAFMAHAAEHGRTSVALGYAEDVESFEVAAREYGATVGRSLGLSVELIPFSLFDIDFSPVMVEAQRLGSEAVMMLAATSACVPVVRAAATIEAPLYLTGACSSDATVRTAQENGVDVVWNAEGPVDGADVEAGLYAAVVDRYAEAPGGGAGTVGFRGFMNVYALLREAGRDVSSTLLADLARGSVDRPSFWGHPYTCDGEQVPGLPALCAPQQLLFTVTEDGSFESVTGWIPTDELFDAALR